MPTRYDIFLIAGLLATALLGLGIIKYRTGGTDTVVIRVDGKEVIRAPLAEDQRFFVDGPLGKTEIEVRDRRVRVINPPCKRKICAQTGWIDKPYQTIICVPNRVVIELLGGAGKDELDGITG